MFSFSNMNSGYSGYSMSNRAVEAYESGEMPLSKWRKCDIVERIIECADDNEIEISEELLNKLTKSELVAHFLYCSSWHHTSSYTNSTDFYSIDIDKIDESTEDEINKIITSRVKKPRVKHEKKESPLKITALCEYNYWTGTRKHPKCNTVEEVLCWTEGDKMVQTSNGRKRMSSITVLFSVKLKTKWLTKEALLKKKEKEGGK